MTNRPLGAAVRYLRTLTDLQSAASTADGQLLDRFARTRDEAAFAALLRRHGPMVLAVCRRVLGRFQDAEDAFQATFLLLARKAASIRKQGSVGSWLHGVARRLALKVKGRDDRRRTNEERAVSMRKTETSVEAAWGDLREALDDALQRLPEHYRTALVICHLEGRTHEEAARQLGCPTATLRSRLTRGRKLLRTELIRRGLTLSAGGLGAALLVSTAEAAPALLLDATLRAALQFAAGGAVSTTAAALANESLKAMGIMKMKIGVILLAALSLVGVGVGAMAQPAAKPPEEKPPAAKRQAEPPKKNEPQVRLDDDGDPLPDGAVRRVGTLRFRQGGGQFDSLLVTPDGKTLVSSTFYGDRTICAWDLATGKLLHSFSSSYDFGQIALSPDGTTLAAPHESDKLIVLSNLASGKELRRLAYNDYSPCSCTFSPDGKTLVSGYESGFIDFWDVTTGNHIERRNSPNKRTTLLAFTADGKNLASGDHLEGTIILWDAASGKEIRQFKRSGVARALAFSPDGAFLACAGGESDSKKKNVIPLWDVKTGKLVHEMPADYAWSVAFSPDGKTLAWAEAEGDHGAIVLCDVSSGKRLRSMDDLPERIAFSPDGKTLISGDGGGVMRLWDVETAKEKTPVEGRRWIMGATASPNGRTLAFCDLKVRLWELIEGREVGALPTECNEAAGLSFSGDGKTLATVDSIDTVSLWDVNSRKLLRRIERDKEGRTWLNSAALAPDGKTLATGQYDGAVVFWDTATGKKMRQVTIQTPGEEAMKPDVRVSPHMVVFAPDGEKLAASGTTPGTGGSRVRLWDVTPDGGEPRLIWEIETPSEGNRSPSGSPWLGRVEPQVVFSPDGRMLAMNRYQKSIPVWEAATGKQRLLLTGHTESTCCVVFAPDGRTLASSGYDDTIRLWDMATGDELRTLRGHRGKANSLAFSADGKTLVSTGDDTTMMFWDVAEVTQRSKPKVVALSLKECEARWTDLAGADAAKAYMAIRAFSTAPGQTASFLGERIRLARSAGKEEVDRLITDLDSDNFAIRDKATAELDELGDTVKPALRKVIDGQPSAEVRSRVNRLLEKLATPAPEPLRGLRAVEALEAVGGSEARTVLVQIAEGAPESPLTREASASLKRLGE